MAFFKRLFGFIHIEEVPGGMRVYGVRTKFLAADIMRLWGTSRIEQNMFEKFSGSAIQFSNFFALDFHYLLKTLLQAKYTRTSKSDIKSILREMEQNTWMKDISFDKPSKLDKSKLSLFHKKPMPHQEGFFDAYDIRTQAYGLNGYILSAAPGTGKAQPLHAKIKTPRGWITMGEVRPGDVVTAWDGTPTRVLSIHPQGKRDVYKITFKDGRTAEACGEHLWKVYQNNEQKRKTYSRIISTEQVIEDLQSSWRRLHIDLIEPENTPSLDYQLDPYLLGVILGDGSITQAGIGITKNDEELFSRISKLLPLGVELVKRNNADKATTYYISRTSPTGRNTVLQILLGLDLMGKASHEKFVPEIYFNGSKDQRLDLLRGLLDTDGTVCKNGGAVSFCSTSKQLAQDVQKLVWSLGGIARVSEKQPHYFYKGEKLLGRKAYIVNIRIKKPSDLFYLSRKKELTRDDGQYAENLKLQIVSVEKVSHEEVQCISIEHPDHLYVTDNFVVTHNTLTSLMLAEMRHADLIVMVVPKNTVYRVWQKAVKEEYIKPQEAWVASDGDAYKGQRFAIVHYEALEKALSALGSGKGNNVVILDESHNLTGDESLRTQFFIKLCLNLKSQDVIWSSGTPFKAMGQEVIPILHTIDPMFTKSDEERYKRIYGKSAQRALDILRNRIGVISYRVEKGEVSTSKPTSKQINVKIRNGNEYTLDSIRSEMRKYIEERTKYYEKNFRQYEKIFEKALDTFEDTLKTDEQEDEFDLYKKYIKQIRKGYDPVLHKELVKFCNDYEKRKIIPTLPKELSDQFKKAKGIIKYMALVVMGECLGSVLGKKRAKCHVEMIPEMNLPDIIDKAQSKTVIFTSYVEVVKAAEAYLKSKGYNPIVVYSGPGMDLAKSVGTFDTNDDVNPLITTYQSLSTGVPLIMANTSVLINQPWRQFELEQAQARTDRLGQQFHVEYYNVFLDTGKEPNVSTRAKEIIEWSKQQVELMTGQKTTIDLTVGLEEFDESDTAIGDVDDASDPMDVTSESLGLEHSVKSLEEFYPEEFELAVEEFANNQENHLFG